MRETLSSIYGIPAGILRVHHGTKIIVGDRPANLLQGDFIRVQLALPGGKRSDHAGCASGPQPPASCDLAPYSISPIRKTITPSCKIHTPRARTPGAPFPPKESKVPGKEERPASTGHCSMEMRAGFEKPCLRASSFTPRWYITHRKRNRTAHTEHGNAPVHKPPRLSLRVTDDSPDRTHASTMLQSQWGKLSRTARSFSMFKHRKEATLVVRRRLSQHIKHSDQVAGLAAAPSGTPQTTAEPHQRPSTDPGLIEVVNEDLCISTSTEDLPVFQAIANKNKARFSELCQAASGKEALGTLEQNSTSLERIERFWTLANETFPRVWKIVTNSIETSATAQILFKSFQYGTRTELQKGLENIHLGISNTAGWTTSLEDAIRDAIPNHGVEGRMSFV